MKTLINKGDAATGTPTVQRQVQYWKYWQQTRSHSGYAAERADAVLACIKELALDQPKILDLGCGTGWFTQRLATLGEATGLDLNAAAMAEARRRCPDVEFLGGDLQTYPFEPCSFDIVVSMQVIAHVADQAALLERIATVLRPGGYLIVTTTNKFVITRLGDPGRSGHRAMGHIENWLSWRALRRLARARFQLLHTSTLRPIGHRGILRVANSPKLNAVLGHFVPRHRIRRIKEKLGLGYTIFLIGRKP